MAKYEYICDNCKIEYTEHRPVEDKQYFTSCNNCGTGNYILK